MSSWHAERSGTLRLPEVLLSFYALEESLLYNPATTLWRLFFGLLLWLRQILGSSRRLAVTLCSSCWFLPHPLAWGWGNPRQRNFTGIFCRVLNPSVPCYHPYFKDWYPGVMLFWGGLFGRGWGHEERGIQISILLRRGISKTRREQLHSREKARKQRNPLAPWPWTSSLQAWQKQMLLLAHRSKVFCFSGRSWPFAGVCSSAESLNLCRTGPPVSVPWNLLGHVPTSPRLLVWYFFFYFYTFLPFFSLEKEREGGGERQTGTENECVCLWVCTHAHKRTSTHMHVYVEARGECQKSLLNYYPPYFLRYALSFKLELRHKARLTGHEAPGIHLSLYAPFLALGLQACLRAEFRSSCWCSKHFINETCVTGIAWPRQWTCRHSCCFSQKGNREINEHTTEVWVPPAFPQFTEAIPAELGSERESSRCPLPWSLPIAPLMV